MGGVMLRAQDAAAMKRLYPRPLSIAEATGLLTRDALIPAAIDYAAFRENVRLTEGMYGTLLSFAFNLGAGALLGSTLWRKLAANDVAGAANEFARWNKADGRVMAGLTRRRAAERVLFMA